MLSTMPGIAKGMGGVAVIDGTDRVLGGAGGNGRVENGCWGSLSGLL